MSVLLEPNEKYAYKENLSRIDRDLKSNLIATN